MCHTYFFVHYTMICFRSRSLFEWISLKVSVRHTVECIENNTMQRDRDRGQKHTDIHTYSESDVCACVFFHIISLSSPPVGIAVSFACTTCPVYAFRHFQTNTTKKPLLSLRAVGYIQTKAYIANGRKKEREEKTIQHTHTHTRFSLTLVSQWNCYFLTIIYYTFDIELSFVKLD